MSETAVPALAVGLDEEELKPVPCDVADMSKGFSAWKSILRADVVELFCWGEAEELRLNGFVEPDDGEA